MNAAIICAMLFRSAAAQRLALRLLGAACLLLFYGLALRSALALSPTSDEPAHFLRAVALRQVNDLRFQTGHAPLSHRLMGLFLEGEPTVPRLTDLSAWPDGERLEVADELMWRAGLDVARGMLVARLPLIWLALLLGALVGSWALLWHGRGAAAVALILYAAEPNVLASAALATTDLPTAATYFGAIYGWWRTWQTGQMRWWWFTAVLTGLALATKMTAVLLLPVLFLLTFLFWQRDPRKLRSLALFAALIPVAALVLWLVYGLQVAEVSGWRLPAAAYVVSWQNVLEHVERGHRAFFLGELSGDGWLAYFPVTFLIKTPLVTLLLALLGLGIIARRRQLWPAAAFLLLPTAALFAAAMTSRLNIGYRHILPIVPFVLLLGATAVLFLRRRRVTQALLALALAWYVASGVRQQPHFLAYFNELVGGTSQGYRYLGDSNLDWGQDLALLARTVAGSPGPWRVSFAGAADPTYYGLEEELIDFTRPGLPFALANPAPGRYAISANHWQGVLEDADSFDWFRRRTPADNLGGSILVYEVTRQQEGAWVAQCLDPGPLISESAAQALLGITGLRQVTFDCRHSWVVPQDGVPGWYVLPQADSWWVSELLPAETGSGLELVYRHRATIDAPSYDVYYWDGSSERFAAALQSEALGSDGRALTLPYPASPAAALAGYAAAPETWVTAWRVLQPTTIPLSVQAHLYLSEDAPPLVADGLGYPAAQWQAGDFFLQRHDFGQGGAAAVYLQSGLYDFQTLAISGELLRLPAPGGQGE